LISFGAQVRLVDVVDDWGEGTPESDFGSGLDVPEDAQGIAASEYRDQDEKAPSPGKV
jgi:hypothetical protein